MFDSYIAEAFFTVALCSGIPVLAGSVCGLIAAVVQTATQIQEQSLSFLARLGAVALVLALGGGWFSARLVQFTADALGSLALLGRLP